MPRTNYVCPRCNYTSPHKIDIRRHFSRQKRCANINGVILSNQIMQAVYDDHVWHPPEEREPIIINNYNTLVGIVNQMDTTQKLDYYLDHQEQKLLDFENELEAKFEYRNERLDNNKFKGGYFLDEDGILKLIDDITRIDGEDINRFNVVMDKVLKRFKIYRCKEWESYLEDIGAKEMISLIKSYYLNNYEIYLIKNLHSDERSTLNRNKLLQHIELYYRFISMFDLTPHIENFKDRELLGHILTDDNDEYLCQRYMKIYFEQKQKLKKSECNQIKRKVINVIKNNTTHNISKLNQKILELIKLDENFRNEIVKIHAV